MKTISSFLPADETTYKNELRGVGAYMNNG
jgi:hypothetical protein